MHKSSAIVSVSLILLACLASAQVAVASSGELPQATDYTFSYTAEVQITGSPGTGNLRVEVYDVPMRTDYQEIQATLFQGRLENIGGREIWVIEEANVPIPNTFSFQATFEVKVDTRNTSPLPRLPLTPISGMEAYLSPDNYVTLSDTVTDHAQQLASMTENDIVEIVSKFADWINKNVEYDNAYGGKIKLTDTQVLNIKKGTCDEFATLFIAFCRAVGLPARHRLGYMVKDRGVEGHAWAEVWLPTYGWLQVDLTCFDAGSARKIVTSLAMGEPPISARVSGAPLPPGTKVGEPSVDATLISLNPISTVDPPAALSWEDMENTWKVSLKNNASMPLLDNVTVKKVVEGESSALWPVTFNQTLIIGPQATYTFYLSKENDYFVFTRMSREPLLLQRPEAFLEVELETWLIILFGVLVGSVAALVVTLIRRR